MAETQMAVAPSVRRRGGRLLARIRGNWQLYLILAVPIAFFVIFHYLPMHGAQIAFREFIAINGVWAVHGWASTSSSSSSAPTSSRGTIINVVLTIVAAYPLSRRDLVGLRLFMFLITFTMNISGGLIPTYQLVRELGMINTASGIGVCVLLDQRHYLREVRAVKGSCQPAVECG